MLSGDEFRYEGETWSADVPAQDGADAPREVLARLRGRDGAKDAGARRGDRGRLPHPSITTPAFVRYTRGNVDADIDIGCTVVASIGHDRDEGRDGAREIAGMYTREQGAEHPRLR